MSDSALYLGIAITPKRQREPMLCPFAPTRPLAKKRIVEDSRIPPPLFDAELMFTELNCYGERVWRHPPPLIRRSDNRLIETYPGK